MPTAARLVAALCLALVALAVSLEVIPRMPESTNFGYFVPVNIGLGLVCGWIVMGRHTRLGIVGALNNGIASVAVLVFWGLLVQGAYEMFRLAMSHRYHGPVEAVYGIFELSVDYAQVLLAPEIIATLLLGGVLSGISTEFAGRLWR
ncbi:TrgA family protein [Antarcticimicrobium luteum]|uniref:TrgA family protein n=1 Tax=Antarcticimicrobium luteum TaxID=2547397 RepID=A0A4R5VDS9_9RHOB|nr:TrgA family protein [Antarcticimicrobium luteum]TDK50294.1 TrgA family protein [Antarcticimicrobium luteum]